jgi:hypothetical protein
VVRDTLKVGGGGGGNGINYAGGLRAGSGGGGSDFVSSGSGGGGRAPSPTAYTNEYWGGYSGAYAASGVSFLGTTYTGLQGVDGNRNGDAGSGGLGGVITPSSNRTSSISGSSVEYSKVSAYRAWEDVSSTSGTKTPGSGGSPNYSYGTDPYTSGGDGANGIVIIRFTILSYLTSPTYSGDIVKGTLESMTVTTNMAGKVRFYFEGKKIPGCLSITATGTAPYLSATCTWKPIVTGTRYVYAIFTPDMAGIAAMSSPKVALFVLSRTTKR